MDLTLYACKEKANQMLEVHIVRSAKVFFFLCSKESYQDFFVTSMSVYVFGDGVRKNSSRPLEGSCEHNHGL